MWAELVLPALLIVGLATRLSALGLMVVTAVAWSAVHAGLGYNVCDNGYKMALILFGGFISCPIAGRRPSVFGCPAEETLLLYQAFSLMIHGRGPTLNARYYPLIYLNPYFKKGS